MNSRLNVLVGAKIQGLEKGLKKAQRSMRKFSRSTEKLGRSFTRSLTLPLAGFAAMSIKAFDTQAKAEAALNTALGDNEQAFKSLTEQAKELQKITLFGDEETIAAQTMLATMGLEEEAIKRLIPLVQDMATAKGMNLTAAADLVAKSVGSSTNALSRYGITIEGAVGSTERLDSAVESLSTMFSGQAQAAAESGTGAWTQLKNAFMDFSEEVGKALLPMLDPLKDKLQEITDFLSSLTKEQIQTGIEFGLFIAAIGPALITLASLTTAISTLSGAFMTLATITIPNLITTFTALEAVMLANPVIAFAAGFVALGVAIYNIVPLFFDAEEEEGNFMLTTKATNDALDEQYKKLNVLIPTYKKTGEAISEVARVTKSSAQAFMDWGETMMGTTSQGIIRIKHEFKELDIQIFDIKDHMSQFVSSFADGFVMLFNKVEDAEGRVLSFGQKFTNFATQFLIDLARMIGQAAVFAGIMAILTGGTSIAMKGTFNSAFNNMLLGTPRATGGSMTGGRPYLVGEHGAEVVIPSGNANIQSASQTATMGIPDVRISGEDLIIVFDRAMRHRNTLG